MVVPPTWTLYLVVVVLMILGNLQLLIDGIHLWLVVVVSTVSLPWAFVVLLLQVALLLLTMGALQIWHPSISSLLLALISSRPAAKVLIPVHEYVFHLHRLTVCVRHCDHIRREVNWVLNAVRVV